MPDRADGVDRLVVEHLLDPVVHRRGLLDELRAGLLEPQKRASPFWFYDKVGSDLFDEITRLPEYYVTRTERAILESCAPVIAARTRAETLVELGSGTSDKTRILLDALQGDGHLRRFVPLDVSHEVLTDAAASVRDSYPGIGVHAIVGDFHAHLGAIPDGGARLVAFLGGTIGNLDERGRQRFLCDLDASLWSTDWLVLGTDLVKDRAVLEAAYDDAAGVTATFNRNLLVVLNRELGADFEVDRFDHVARWNEEERWIEMRLRSTTRQHVTLPALDLEIDFEPGEDLWTEISAKFTEDQVAEELWRSGFVTEETFTDPERRFLLTLARPYC
jgi:L-histidine N-alpha-methyltransferase